MIDYHEEFLCDRETLCRKDKRARVVSMVRVCGEAWGSVSDSFLSYAGACAVALERVNSRKYDKCIVVTGDKNERSIYTPDSVNSGSAP